jgi:DNA-binding response OmpR family regulator
MLALASRGMARLHGRIRAMKILLLCHDLTTRMNLTSVWAAAGVTMLKPASEDVPDCIVVDLGRRDSLDEIARLRALHPAVPIVACFATYNEEAVAAAREAGATEFAARSFVDRRVARLLKLDT